MVEKKIKDRKRHVCTDMMGNLLFVKVHAANKSDTIEGCDIAYQTRQKYDSIKAFCADQGYRGTTENFIKNELKMNVDITKKLNSHEFQVNPRRLVVERFFAWLGNYRRFAKDYEINPLQAEQLITVSACLMLIKRLF